MRVGVNALLLTTRAGYRQSGVSRYIERLLRALPSRLGDDEIVTFAGQDVNPPAPALVPGWRRTWWPVERPEARILWEHTALPLAARRARLDLFHGTVNVVPAILPCRSVVTIHDLAFLRYPDQVPARRHRYLSRGVRSAAERATRVIAVSESTKADVVELLGVDPSRISVTPLGVDESFRPLDDEALEAFREEQGIVRPYILWVGTLEPRKNLPTLLRAFASLAPDLPHELVVVGAEGWLTGDIHDTYRSLGIDGRVRFVGFAQAESLPSWYGAADLFVFPSLYEGFGLPALEAMACGAAVVTSAVSSLPEVVGDAALMVDPDDEKSLTEAIGQVLTDPALAADMRRKGLRRAAEFTWERTAELTTAVYREALR